MKGAIKWMAGHHVAANLLMLFFIIGGLILGKSVKQEVFPEVILDVIQVSVDYPGAAPEDIEEGICLKIEEKLSSISGIKKIKSTAIEGNGTVTAELLTGTDPDAMLQEITSEVNRITTFPQEAEKPVISKLDNRKQVVSLAIYGRLSERALKELAEAVRDDLRALPEITQTAISGVRPYEISIEISEKNLRRFGLTLETVAAAVRRASLDLPAGTIKTTGGEILIRTKERRYTGLEYGNITILARPDGTELKLHDIAAIKDGFRETDENALFDGQPAALIQIFRIGAQKPIAISNAVKRYVEKKRRELPPSIHLTIWNDRSDFLRDRMHLLLKNAYLGLILVLVTLSLFLEMRLAFWVTVGIPISFLGALFFMPALAVSINMISLFAFIMALGIVVDDAIVVGENIYTHRQTGKPFSQAAADGCLEVAGPVVFSVLTTVAAFVPLLFVSGSIGKFIKVIPAIVITILLISLTESLFILPAHLSAGGKHRVRASGLPPGAAGRFRAGFAAMLDDFINGPFHRFLAFSLRNRYSAIAVFAAMLMILFGLVAGGRIKFIFMPEVEGDVIYASLVMPPGTPIEKTGQIQKRLIDKAQKLSAGYDRQLGLDYSILNHIYSVAGSQIPKGGPGAAATSTGANLCEVATFLKPSDLRKISSLEFAGRWRRMVGEIPGAESLTYTANVMQLGAPIDIQIAHNDYGVLTSVKNRIKDALRQYPGVTDIADSHTEGKREIKLSLTPEARTLGITEEDLAGQVRSAFYGAEALRLQRGRDEIKVMIRYPENERRSLDYLENMRLRTPDGGEVPFYRAARIEDSRGYSTIRRTDEKRVIDITANIDSKKNNAEEILADLDRGLLNRISRDYPGLTYSFEGEEQEQQDSVASLKRGFSIALFVMFALLAIPFKSYVQPLIVIIAIPFGIGGAILGHMIMGYNISMLSIFGAVALSGIVVNDSLILVDFINRHRDAGPVLDTVIAAGERRFRPIILTSLTTFFGLTPMIFETSVQARFLVPMAISLGFGILFATGITLVLTPALYMVLEDLKRFKNMAGGSSTA